MLAAVTCYRWCEMWISKAAKFCERVFYPPSRMFCLVGGIFIIVLMLFTLSTVILRYLFNSPIPGDYELTEFALVVLVAFAVAETMARGRHVTITFFSLPGRAQAICNSVTYFFCLIIFSLIAWRTTLLGNTLLKAGQHSGILHLPVAPFRYVLVFGSVLLCLVLVVKILHFVVEGWRR